MRAGGIRRGPPCYARSNHARSRRGARHEARVEPRRLVRLAVIVVSVAMALYHMWAIAFGAPEAIPFRGTHLLFALVLMFLLYRVRTMGRTRPGSPTPSARLCAARARARRRSSTCSSITNTSSPASSTSTTSRPDRHDHGHDHGADRARGDAAGDRLGAADHGDRVPGLRPVHRAARADADARSALHDDRGHLRHPARRCRPPTC